MKQKIQVTFIITGLIIGILFFAGCTGENSKPIVSFTVEPTIVNLNENVYFNSTSTDSDGSITKYTWKINDEVISSKEKFTHIFTENGSYHVTLTVLDNDNGINSTSKKVTIGLSDSFVKEKLLGIWYWEQDDQNQRAWFTFYENNTLKTVFRGGVGNATSTEYWTYVVNESGICYEPHDPFYDPGCYEYEFFEDYKVLYILDENGNETYWVKVQT